MDQTPAVSTAPVQIPQAAPPQQKQSNPFIFMICMLIAFIAGGALVYFFPVKKDRLDYLPPIRVENNKVTLPTNAIQIQKCADYKGTLYVEPENIPVGPVYMVKDGEVIGIEYMLSKEEFLSGKSYKFLKGLGLKVDHVNIGLLSQGHEGYAVPHYHVDIYTVSKDTEQHIMCPAHAVTPVPETPKAASGAANTTTATPSAAPSTNPY